MTMGIVVWVMLRCVVPSPIRYAVTVGAPISAFRASWAFIQLAGSNNPARSRLARLAVRPHNDDGIMGGG